MDEFLNLPVRYLHKDKSETLTLSQLQLDSGSPALIVDLWHTKCTKCPAALSKLNEEAADTDKDKVLYISLALSQGPDNYDVAADVSQGEWENMTHLFMDEEVKQRAKSLLGYNAVPFYVVVGKGGNVIGNGEPKHVDVPALIESDAAIENKVNTISTLGELVLDEDF